ncbi:MAG: nicotinate (nicotinamide) nucleotide adenylyltransferase [Oscillospiraceae bacterium]|nr:nicotinate (nicotinamide) nucleotide adenylyltransferase [Oscillospiraceae bacterium]
MELAIYGGSFNPPHLGHREAIRTAQRELKADRLLVIPDNIPPHKELDEDSPEAEERLKLCELAFGDLPGVEVSPLELQRSGRSYTFDTVRELEESRPDARITLIIGTDMFLSFEEWYQFAYLLEHCRLAVLAREEDDEPALEQKAAELRKRFQAEIRILEHEPLPMHSTEIREALGRRSGADDLPAAVYAEIIRRRLYGALPELSWLREQAYAMLDENRIAHVAGCEQEAVQLARAWGENPETAAEAGILHDITKRLSYEEQLNLCEKYAIILDAAECAAPKLLHARTGAAVAGDLFGSPAEICEAIRWHTTGKPDMSLLEKIVYLADYIEPTRVFPGVDKIRRLAYEDLDEAMRLGLQMTMEEVRAKGQEPYADTVNACAWYEARIRERSE